MTLARYESITVQSLIDELLDEERDTRAALWTTPLSPSDAAAKDCMKRGGRYDAKSVVIDWVKRQPSLAGELVTRLVDRIQGTSQHMFDDKLVPLLKDVVATCPGSSDYFVAATVEMCSGHNHYTQHGASFLSRLVQDVCPGKEEEIFFGLLQPCRHASSEARCEAINRLMCSTEWVRPENAGRIYAALLELLHKAESKEVLIMAMKHLTRKSNMWPDKAVDIIEELLPWMYSQDAWFRHQFYNLIQHMIGRCPVRDQEIVDAVLHGVQDVDELVQREAMLRLGQAAKACPDRGDVIASMLLERCKSVSQRFTINATKQLIEAASVWPDRMDEVVEVVLRESNSRRDDAYDATSVMARLAQACPHSAERIVSRLLELYDVRDDGLRDDGLSFYKWSVGRTAMCQMADSLAQCQVKNEEAIELVLRECSNKNACIREAAVSQLGVLAAVCPERSKQIVRLILARCDDDETKLTAICQIAKAAVASPEWADILMKKLLRICGSSNWSTKMRAMAELAQVVKVCRGRGRHIVVVLIWGCTDRDERVSDAAKEDLKEALRACPEGAAAIIARLIQMQSLDEEMYVDA